MLDMYEFGVSELEKHDRIPTYERGITPVLLFQGDHFETDDTLQHVKNLLIDNFYVTKMEECNIPEMRRVLVFTATDEKTIKVQEFEVASV